MADLLDENLDAYRAHFRGADAVVHLGYYRPPEHGRHRRRQDLPGRAPERGHGRARLPRLALEEGVRRVVVASSNHAADWYEPAIHGPAHRRHRPGGPRPSRTTTTGGPRSPTRRSASSTPAGPSGASWRSCRCASAPRGRSTRRSTRGAPSSTSATWGPTSARGTSSSSSCARSRPAAIADEFGVPFQIFYGVSQQHPRLLEHRQRPAGDRLRPGGRLRDALRRRHPARC